MKVVAVTNQKGGVGKTTTALALAAELALAGQRVLAIDLDPQGNLGMGIGVEDGEPTVYEVLTARVPLDEAARPVRGRRLGRLRVVPAGPRLARAEGELLGQIGFDELLKRSLGRCESADVAVLDCPPSLGALTINAVGAADLVVAPVQCEFFSARGAMKLLEIVELVRERRNPELAFRVVPTLFDQRNNICRAVLNELRREFGEEVSATTVGVDTRVRESQARQLPIGVYAPRSRAAVAYRALAAEVSALLVQEVAHAQAA
ncbi:MAG: ParA family protein [Planctomycetota bacterium]